MTCPYKIGGRFLGFRVYLYPKRPALLRVP